MVYRENIAAVLHAAHDLRMEEWPIEEPQEGEVQIHVRATGICGSDLHYYHEGGLGPYRLEPGNPMILGHESSGVVVQLGPGVTSLKVGDRVAIEPGRACGACDRCTQGEYNLCPRMKFASSLRLGPNHGSLRRYVCCPEKMCHRMPDDMSFEEGALMEPLSVAVHAVGRVQQRAGPAPSTVAVVGAGPIGLLVAAAAFVAGASECLLLDVNPSRLEFAAAYLPKLRTKLLPSSNKKNDDDDVLDNAKATADDIKDTLFEGQDKIDAVYECVGLEATIGLAMYLARPGGVVMMIGLGKNKVVMPTDVIVMRQVDVLGNFRYANVYKKSIELVHQRKISVKELVTHRFALEDTLSAFQTATQGGNGVIKIQIGDFRIKDIL